MKLWLVIAMTLLPACFEVRPPRIDISCLIRPEPSGVIIVECADPDTWKQFYQRQGRT